MGKKTSRKLSIKRETLRQLDSLSEEQLRRAAGGTKLALEPIPLITYGCTGFCAGVRTTLTGPTTPTNDTCLRCTTEGWP